MSNAQEIINKLGKLADKCDSTGDAKTAELIDSFLVKMAMGEEWDDMEPSTEELEAIEKEEISDVPTDEQDLESRLNEMAQEIKAFRQIMETQKNDPDVGRMAEVMVKRLQTEFSTLVNAFGFLHKQKEIEQDPSLLPHFKIHTIEASLISELTKTATLLDDKKLYNQAAILDSISEKLIQR